LYLKKWFHEENAMERLTLDDGKQDNDDEEEESQIEEDTINLIGITIR